MRFTMSQFKCVECRALISDFEKTDHDSLCLDCYKEKNPSEKTQTTHYHRMKNKKYTSTTVME
jgi:hypothetical protein